MTAPRLWRDPHERPPIATPRVVTHCTLGTAALAALFLACGPSRTTLAREQSLHSCLQVMRGCIGQFRADTGRYPSSLQDLVSAGNIRSVPIDPITQSAATWRVVLAHQSSAPPPRPQVIGVQSGAAGLSSSGTPYASW